MEEKEPIKINLSTLLLIVLVLIIIALVFYICIEKSNNQKQMNDSDIRTSNIEDIKDNLQEENDDLISNTIYSNNTSNINSEELNIDSEKVKKLYNYIPAMECSAVDKANAYQDSKVTKDNMDPEYLLAYAFTQLSLSNSDVELVEGTSVESGWYLFDANILQQKVKEIYGESNIENVTFNPGTSEACEYQDGKYFYSYGGSVERTISNIRTIEKVYEEQENLYIEDKYIGLVVDSIDETCELYANSKVKDLVKELKYSDFIQLSSENQMKEIKNNYSNLMTKYKHTFKKNANGDYYWYSTEPIK